MAAKDYVDTVLKAYKAYYGRAGESSGTGYWAAMVDQKGGSFDSVIASFSNSAESRAMYGGLNNTDLINKIYQNLFGRNADAAGLNYWKGKLDSGAISAGQMALTIANGAQATDLDKINSFVASAKGSLDQATLNATIQKYTPTTTSGALLSEASAYQLASQVVTKIPSSVVSDLVVALKNGGADLDLDGRIEKANESSLYSGQYGDLETVLNYMTVFAGKLTPTSANDVLIKTQALATKFENVGTPAIYGTQELTDYYTAVNTVARSGTWVSTATPDQVANLVVVGFQALYNEYKDYGFIIL